MIADRDLVCIHLKGSMGQGAAVPRDRGEQWLRDYPAKWGRGQVDRWELLPVPSCRCCGEPAWANLRCTKHQERNPCVVEGCSRTVKAHRDQLADDQAICGTHWRAYVPPRSPMRLAYNRFWRIAKKRGWDAVLIRRFNRFWDALVARVRRAATEGQIDEAEIRKMFGWDDA